MRKFQVWVHVEEVEVDKEGDIVDIIDGEVEEERSAGLFVNRERALDSANSLVEIGRDILAARRRAQPKGPITVVDEEYLADSSGNFILQAWMRPHRRLLPFIAQAINALLTEARRND